MGMRLDYQPYTSPEGWYSFAYPEYWEMEVIEGIPAFYDPNGAGAFLISAFKNINGENYDLDEEISRFLSQHEIKYEEDKVASFENSEGTKVKACEFISKERFWLVYILANGNKLIVCTYNSDESPDRELAQILTTMVSSIKFFQYE
ncbi:MAG: DUF3805 domain-containing protein [Leptospiraceae bacterium]|nr:DUF3805 domain-containing protein [Leptospiraceae bacterium]